MRSHSRARASSGPYALTAAALLGRGAGSVVTQWLIRNSGASAGPRLGAQVAGSVAGVVSVAGGADENGVSCVSFADASRYQGAAPAWCSASTTSRVPASIIAPSVVSIEPANVYGARPASPIARTKSSGVT